MPIRTSLARARLRTRPRDRPNQAGRLSKPSGRPGSSPHSSSNGGAGGNMAATTTIPDLYTRDPPIWDLLETATSQTQDATVDECRPYLAAEIPEAAYNSHGVPNLDRPRHAAFLRKHLEKLPGAYMTADASRPWLFYWCLNGLRLLGQDISPFRDNLVDTARSMQNEAGGFGGGFGQRSHLATTYALVLALALVGGEEACEVINRESMWKWLSSLKQADGAFRMSLDGEVDVRYEGPRLWQMCPW